MFELGTCCNHAVLGLPLIALKLAESSTHLAQERTEKKGQGVGQGWKGKFTMRMALNQLTPFHINPHHISWTGCTVVEIIEAHSKIALGFGHAGRLF